MGRAVGEVMEAMGASVVVLSEVMPAARERKRLFASLLA
jgi:hypothetical protein